MFKVQIALGFLLSFRFNIINTLKELPASTVLNPTQFNKYLFGHCDYRVQTVLHNAFSRYNRNDINPDELGSYFGGDLLVPIDELSYRNSIIEETSLWPDGLVPFDLNGDFQPNEINAILFAFNQFTKQTCIKFYQRINETDYISIERKEGCGCYSSAGRLGGKQVVNLSPPYCFIPGVIMHELMHALGFLHEHNRNDRDKYIEIQTENIKPYRVSQFFKHSIELAYSYGLPYDYGSILHYTPYAASKNGKPTLVALQKVPPNIKVGQREHLSSNDVKKLNIRYQCEKNTLYRKLKNSLDSIPGKLFV